jgi:DNA-binding LacI/PurR family transcriptional regulator
VPTVLVGQPVGLDPVNRVDADNRGGAREAVNHLIERGRRRIAPITGAQDMGVGVDRLAGYHDALAEADLSNGLIAYGDFSEDAGVKGMRELLECEPDLDAVFTASDPMAIGAMRVLKEHGRRIPDDVAVVGFDDSPPARHTEPPLTSVHQPLEAMGREMARLLHLRIKGEAPERPTVILETHLVVRESS